MHGHSGPPHGPEGTIYEQEKGFDLALRIEINPTKIKFIQELKRSGASSIFHVNYYGKSRVLKVVCALTVMSANPFVSNYI
jgi:hypothetical protein